MAFGGFAPMPLRLGGDSREGWSPEQHARMAADAVAKTRAAPFARFRYTKSGATVTIIGYKGRNGTGSAYAPTVTVHGTGDVTFTWPSVYEDPYGKAVAPDFGAVLVSINGATQGRTYATYTANTIRVRTRNTVPADADLPVSVRVWGEAGLDARSIGDYAGQSDKCASDTEGSVPYAAQWYHELQSCRGSAYSTQPGTLVHCENLAIARLFAAWASRFPEKIRANAIPGKADEKLPYWVKVLGVPVKASDQKWRQRELCAAHFRAVNGPTLSKIRDALSGLLGDAFVDVIQSQGVDLDTPPDPTCWPNINPGASSYSLGGGAWYSRRCHLVVQVVVPSRMTVGQFLQAVQVDMHQLLDRMLPVWATFSWTTFDTIGGVDGFFLDISQLDFTGLT